MGTIPRASTGVLGFDELIEGGLPVGSVMLLAGPPGAGKTTFSAKFLFEGATMLGEKGVYVCFAETKDSLVRSMLRFGWDFDRLDREQRCIILDLSTAKEAGIQKNLDEILGAISSLGAKRLVIDSFTAFTMALKEPINIRHLIHLLYRFLKNLGCTTIIVTDTPWSSERIGSGVEEFIADSIILMQSRFNEKRQLERTLRILKMRSTDHSQKVHDYKITSKGIEILP